MNSPMVETREEKKRPLPDIVKIQQIHKKMTKKSRKKEFLKLLYSNPQRLLELIKNLIEDCTISQQIKVNLYLQNETGCWLSFLMEKCVLYNEYVVKVIGTKELPYHVRFQKNNEFIARLEQSETPISLIKELLDIDLLESLVTILDDFQLSLKVKCHFFPIFNPLRKNIIMYSCLVQEESSPSQLDVFHGYVGECFRYCQQIVVNTMRYEEEKIYHSKKKAILELGICNLDLIDNFSEFIISMREQIVDVADAERCNLYTLDGGYVVSRITDNGVSYETFRKDITNVKIPLGVSIAGIVAETGKAINCFDPQNDPLYRKDLDLAGGLITRNLLCFPLMLYERVYGVVEVINKTIETRFGGADVSHCEDLGKVLGLQLYMALLTKKNRDGYSRRALIDSFMLHPSRSVEGSDISLVSNCDIRHEYDDTLDYTWPTTPLLEGHDICFALHTFKDLDVLRKLDLDRTAVVRFLLRVKQRERALPFHGWGHAINTLHFLYTIIKKENIIHNDNISAMECFCMLTAALCHDMEYRGSVSAYKPTSGHVLGALYSSPGSVVQFHSIDQTVRLLNECELTDSLDLKHFKELLLLLDTMILGMDLGNHIYSRGEVKRLIEERKILKAENRRHYFGLLLTCSDISDFCKPWHHLEALGARFCEEFFTAELTPDAMGLIEFSDMFENVKLKTLMLQIQFIQKICEPAFR